MGSFIAIDNREKSWDCPSSSNNPVVSDNRRSDNRDLTVFTVVRSPDQSAKGCELFVCLPVNQSARLYALVLLLVCSLNHLTCV